MRRLVRNSFLWFAAYAVWFGTLWWLSSRVNHLPPGLDFRFGDKLMHFGYFFGGSLIFSAFLFRLEPNAFKNWLPACWRWGAHAPSRVVSGALAGNRPEVRVRPHFRVKQHRRDSGHGGPRGRAPQHARARVLPFPKARPTNPCKKLPIPKGIGLEPDRPYWRRSLLITVTVVGLTGALDEWHQSRVPGRFGNDPADFTADLVGAVAGALVFRKLHRLIA